MSVVFCGVCPHPPIAVPEVGHEESKIVIATQQALTELGERIKQSGAEAVVIISPHAPVFQNVVAINTTPVLTGDLTGFGANNLTFNLDNDQLLASGIAKQSTNLGLEVINLDQEAEKNYHISLRLDHGVAVPLYFLRKAGVDLPLVHVAMAVAPTEKLYLFGVAVRQATRVLGRKVALLASGDLSHGLTADAPSGYLPRGAEFDEELVDLLSTQDVEGLLRMEPALVQEAGECGYRSIVMMLGGLDGYSFQSEILSYEGPFGVGYLVAALKPEQEDKASSIMARLELEHNQEIAQRRIDESFLVRVARETLERHVKGEPQPIFLSVPEEFKGKKAGAFVSIKKRGNLRGCIGTIQPTKSSVLEEVIANAISAGIHDSRFQPVEQVELGELEYSVDVLQQPEAVSSLQELDSQKYGVIVQSGDRSGLLLPNIEGVDTVEEQVDIARRKAGIMPNEPVRLERFEVLRYE